MNNKKDVIVVEGTSDVNKLSSLVDADFVITNGSEVSRETIGYLKNLSQFRRIIILTDPDYPGMQIRNKLSQEIPSALHAYIDRSKASNGKKLGVAECDKDEIIRALSKVIKYEKKEESEKIFTESILFSLGLTGQNDSSYLREKVFKHFNLGYGNSKTLCKRLNMIDVTLDEVKEYVEGVKNENSK